jgi:hypothetical protein
MAAFANLVTVVGQRLTFRSQVDLAGVSFNVTDAKGKYVRGVKPADIAIFEDGVKQQPVSFSEPSSRGMPVEENVFVLIEKLSTDSRRMATQYSQRLNAARRG